MCGACATRCAASSRPSTHEISPYHERIIDFFCLHGHGLLNLQCRSKAAFTTCRAGEPVDLGPPGCRTTVEAKTLQIFAH